MIRGEDMPKYSLLQLGNTDSGDLYICCSEPKILIGLVEQIGKGISYAKLTCQDERYLFIQGVKKNANFVMWWIIQILCRQGWEPFSTGRDAVVHEGSYGYEESYVFRKELVNV